MTDQMKIQKIKMLSMAALERILSNANTFAEARPNHPLDNLVHLGGIGVVPVSALTDELNRRKATR